MYHYNIGDIVLMPMRVDSISIYEDSIIYHCLRINKSNGTTYMVKEEELKGKIEIQVAFSLCHYF